MGDRVVLDSAPCRGGGDRKLGDCCCKGKSRGKNESQTGEGRERLVGRKKPLVGNPPSTGLDKAVAEPHLCHVCVKRLGTGEVPYENMTRDPVPLRETAKKKSSLQEKTLHNYTYP